MVALSLPLRRVLRLAVMAGAFAAVTALPARAAAPDPDSLHRRALRHLEGGTPDHYRLAIEDLEVATRAAPTRTDLLHRLAHTYALLNHLERARSCYDRITRVTPDDAESQLQIGLLWKWEWLASLDAESYAKALQAVLRAASLDRRRLEPRLALTALALAKNNLSLAEMGAQSAVACDRRSPEAALALACAAYRAGRLGQADSAFRAAIPALATEQRRRFGGLAAIAWNAAPPDSAAGAAAAIPDPDLTTRVNEAELELRSRVAHALLLFRDRNGVRWDVRAELMARYGVPARVEMAPPPAADEDVFTEVSFGFRRLAHVFYAPEPSVYPVHLQTWIYPELGIRAPIWDRSLGETYELPVGFERDPDPRPDPAALAARPDLLAVGGGRGVLRTMAPNVRPMTARAHLAQLPSAQGAQMLIHLDAPAPEKGSLTGTFVIVDSAGRERARGSGALGLSACAPDDRRIAQFHADLPPGDYRIHLAADDGRGQRGLARLETRVAPPDGRLAIGDLVILCSASAAYTPVDAIVIEPSFDRRLGSARTMAMYFEAEPLATDERGASRFAYRCTVRPLDPDLRPEQRRDRTIEFAREEEHVGARRRQFVTAPVGGLPRGAYEVEIEVRDLLSGAVATRTTRFEKR